MRTIVVCQIQNVFLIPMDMFNSSQHWLLPWRSELRGRQLLELGSGAGQDTLTLKQQADGVVCSDVRRDRWQTRVADIADFPFVQLDHLRAFPFRSDCFDGVVAGLCLHYFSRADTFRVLNEIQRVLKPGGLLFARVNSVKDVNHGAGVGEQIEPGYYYQENAPYARYKRFFTRGDVEDFLNRWVLQHLAETQFVHYGNEKVAWEFVARPSID